MCMYKYHYYLFSTSLRIEVHKEGRATLSAAKTANITATVIYAEEGTVWYFEVEEISTK